jgi:hypothetical protein
MEQKMKDTSNKIEKVLDMLFGQVVQGEVYFYNARSIYKAFQKNNLLKMSNFFFGIYLASIREAVLALARIVDANSNSISIYYLFNLVENNSRLLSQEDAKHIRDSIADQKAQLKIYDHLFVSVFDQRDRVLAHLDKKHINDPSNLFGNPKGVNLTDLGKCLNDILDILEFYYDYFEREHNISNIEEEITGDVDIILKWMNQYSKPDDWIRPPVFNIDL